MDYSPGELVVSLAGRDSGRIFMVVGAINDRYIMISDGDLRKVEKPKKKKIKHVKSMGIISDLVKYRLGNNIKISNADIRKEIKELSIKDGEVF